MEKKVVYRICTIADYDREAFYLREMPGWVKISSAGT